MSQKLETKLSAGRSDLDSSAVSVVTPAYNACADIERTVRSVSEQTLPVLEHIIVDDGSTDGTAEVLERLQDEHPHLTVVRQGNLGAAAARNRAIERCQGRFIAFLDSDDEWGSSKLARQIAFMQETGTLFSYGDYMRRDQRSGVILGTVLAPDQLSHSDFLKGCPIGCLTVAYDQNSLGKCFMPNVRRGHDWGLWLALTRDGVVARRYPGVEAVYSVQAHSLSTAKLRKAADIYRIYRNQECLGWSRSIRLLGAHVLNSLRGYRNGN
ncbi:glycosyltransferase family 2 protein [Wenzhouxiangella limi]|uniref:Glycosyltransferase family 2 protein n=1 Tax=Wenzhouxiangella limi TaxID=2707351 RepID=A0A845VDE6_9GAMM|nr:glycosyltransferase family 2 protein [Wenzhouxiangella limi]NDY95289.1 glycosyltransferase family 2 protein [Wenzhouxiangella limi]